MRVPSPAAEGERLERAVFEIKKVIVGQDRLVERMLVGLLARGHLLLEGVPGVAKTLAVETVAKVVGGTFARLQFTPDLVPSDILGTRIYRQGREEFDVELGPVVANFVLADEINRAPAKVQSALLEVMAERHLSIGGQTLPDARPVPRARHPEPHRERGRLPAAGSPARPVPLQDHRGVPRRRGGARDRLPDGRRAAGRPAGARRPPSCRGCRPSPPGCSCTTRSSTTWCGWSWPPAPPPSTASPTSRAGSPTAPRPAPRSASSRPPARSRSSAAATTCCPRTCWTSRPDVLRHRLVLSYDAVADQVPIDHIISRVLATVPLPQVTARPQAPRGGNGAVSAPMNTAPPSLRGGTAGGRAQGARADGADPAGRAAAGQPPRARPRPGLRAGRGPRLPARRRRAAHRLGGHRPHHRAARAPDRGRPRAGDVGAGRPVAQPRLRHRRVREARPRHRGARRGRAPHPGRRQPDRRARRHRGAARALPGPRRPGATRAGCSASVAQVPSAPSGTRGDLTRGDRAAAPPAPAPRPRRGGVRLPRRAHLGGHPARAVRAPRAAGRRGARPARAGAARGRHGRAGRPGVRSPARGRHHPAAVPGVRRGRRRAPRAGGARPAPGRARRTCGCAPTRDWIADVVRFALTRKRAWSGGGR